MAQTSIRFDDRIQEWLDDRLVPGQSKSIWYRYAFEATYAADQYLDDIYEPYQYEERKELIEAAVQKEVKRRKEEIDN